MKFGTHHSFGHKNWGEDLRGRIQKAGEIGFDVVEVDPFPYAHGQEAEGLELAKFARDCGIELAFCCGFPKDCDMASDDAAIRENGVRYMETLFGLMEKMDAKLLVGALYSTWPTYRSMPVTPEEKQAVMERTAEAFARATAKAGDYGVTCAIECLNRFEHWLINCSEECAGFVDMVGNPNVGVHFDTFHMNVEENSIKGAILTAGHRLKALHVAERNRRLPGTGDFLWDDFFSGLAEIGYDGYMDIEAFIVTGGTICADIALWRDLTGGASLEEIDRQNAEALAFLKGKSKEYGLI